MRFFFVLVVGKNFRRQVSRQHGLKQTFRFRLTVVDPRCQISSDHQRIKRRVFAFYKQKISATVISPRGLRHLMDFKSSRVDVDLLT